LGDRQIGRFINRRFKHLSTIKSFEELPVWQDARKFTNKIYNITNKFPKEELYGLTSQIRRATVSIMSNIAEGFDRRSDKELSNFLSMARGSSSEVQNDLYIALDLKYISEEEFKKMYAEAKKIAKQINGLMTYLKSGN
jgi:four helix bundle protein